MILFAVAVDVTIILASLVSVNVNIPNVSTLLTLNNTAAVDGEVRHTTKSPLPVHVQVIVTSSPEHTVG